MKDLILDIFPSYMQAAAMFLVSLSHFLYFGFKEKKPGTFKMRMLKQNQKENN
jgi:hypothetical protein